jgi:phage gpG-like protein
VLEIEGAAEFAIVASDFYTLADGLEDPSEPLQEAVETVMAPSIRENFEAGGRPAWEPLMDTTLSHSKRAGTDGRPLILTGMLMETASSVEVWSIDEESAHLDSGNLGDAYYGLFHQAGYGATPAREWAVMQPEDEERIEEIFDGWVEGNLVKSAFIRVGAGALARFFARRR